MLLAASGGLLAPSVTADFAGESWRFFKPLLLPAEITQESLAEVVPDTDIFAHARQGLSDLRVIESDSGREVPYKLIVDREERRRSSFGGTMRDLGILPGQYTSFVVDLGQEGVLHNELEVRTASQNFQRRVTVEGSKDGEVWAVLQDDAQIFDFTITKRSFTARDTRVHYPSATSRYLRVRIIDEDEPPLAVVGSLVFFQQELSPRETETSAAILERMEDSAKRRTLLSLDLGSQGIPIHRLSISTGQDNFYRQVSLEGSTDGKTWNGVMSSGTLYSYNTPKFVGSKLGIAFRESTFRYYRLTIINEDNPVLPVDNARAYGFLRKLIFSVAPGETYSLYYGNEDARAPSYELERIFPYLVTENLPQARLGAHAANPLFLETPEPPEPIRPFTERYPWLLATAVALASLLVGLFLANLVRQVRTLLPPPRDDG